MKSRIDAITCCVGYPYAKQLEKNLPIWLDTLDSLTVITTPSDPIAEYKHSIGNLRIVTTDAFTKYGASFNKGAALCYAFRKADPIDWCLHFDCDIQPPQNWRKLAEKKMRKGCLHGCTRINTKGVKDRHHFFPYGFFQLWHVEDKVTWKWPLFETWHGHAGTYDTKFAEQWNLTKRIDLKFSVVHCGDLKRNWFGLGRDDRMKKLLEYGTKRYREEAKLEGGGLKIPQPFKIQILEGSTHWTLAALRECREVDPFKINVIVGKDLNTDRFVLNSKITISRIRESMIRYEKQNSKCGVPVPH